MQLKKNYKLIKILRSSIKSSKNPTFYRAKGDEQVRFRLINDCLKIKVYTTHCFSRNNDFSCVRYYRLTRRTLAFCNINFCRIL